MINNSDINLQTISDSDINCKFLFHFWIQVMRFSSICPKNKNLSWSHCDGLTPGAPKRIYSQFWLEAPWAKHRVFDNKSGIKFEDNLIPDCLFLYFEFMVDIYSNTLVFLDSKKLFQPIDLTLRIQKVSYIFQFNQIFICYDDKPYDRDNWIFHSWNYSSVDYHSR